MSQNFPLYNLGQVIAATPTSAATQIAATPAEVAASDVLIYNPGPGVVYARSGGAGVVADAACMPIGPKTKEVFSKGAWTHLAVISPLGAQSITVFLGSGV